MSSRVRSPNFSRTSRSSTLISFTSSGASAKETVQALTIIIAARNRDRIFLILFSSIFYFSSADRRELP